MGEDLDRGIGKRKAGGVLRTVYKNSLLNILTQVFVLAVTFVAIPRILHGLGDTSFGILSLVLVFIGYFSLVDFGIGRAVVKFVADMRSLGDVDGITGIFDFSCLLSLIIGSVVGMFIYIFAGMLAHLLFKVPDGIGVVITCIKIVAATMPFMVLQGILRGTLMGYERFDVTNMLQAVNGVGQWGGVLILVLLGEKLVIVVAFVALLRILVTVLHFAAVLHFSHIKIALRVIDLKRMVELLKFGGWVMVSQVLSPILQYLERFVLSATIATSVLPFYVIPFEATSKLLIFATAIASALFPGLSGIGSSTEPGDEFKRIYRVSVKMLVYLMMPLGIVLMTFGHEILSVWIGASFAVKSLVCFQTLVAAFVINSVAQIPYTALHARGKPNITGIFHLVELPIHILVVFMFVKNWGVLGAAAATLIRMGLDLSLLLWASHQELGLGSVISKLTGSRMFLPVLIAAAWTIGGLVLDQQSTIKTIFTLLALSLYLTVIARYSLDKMERDAIFGTILRRLRAGKSGG